MVFNVKRHQVYFLRKNHHQVYMWPSLPSLHPCATVPVSLPSLLPSSINKSTHLLHSQCGGQWREQCIVNVVKSNSCDSLSSLRPMIHYQVYLCPALPSLLLCFISKFTPLFHYQFHKLASFQSLLTCQCLPSPLACFMIKSTRHDYAISNPLCGLCHLKPIMLIM